MSRNKQREEDFPKVRVPKRYKDAFNVVKGLFPLSEERAIVVTISNGEITSIAPLQNTA